MYLCSFCLNPARVDCVVKVVLVFSVCMKAKTRAMKDGRVSLSLRCCCFFHPAGVVFAAQGHQSGAGAGASFEKTDNVGFERLVFGLIYETPLRSPKPCLLRSFR